MQRRGMGVPHAVVLPLPYQGHVIPLMELSHRLVDHGFKVTFVNTEHNHERVVAAVSGEEAVRASKIRLVSVPDGLEPGDDHNNLTKLLNEGLPRTLPQFLEGLVAASRAPGGGGDEVRCFIFDGALQWAALSVARATGVRAVKFSPMSALMTLAANSIPKLLEDGIVDANGAPMTDEAFCLGAGVPPIKAAHLPWNCLGDRESGKKIFHFFAHEARKNVEPDFVICNSFQGIEEAVFAHAPHMRPIGPLLRTGQGGQLAGNFWPEDLTSASWLDAQAPGSVVYVAFGSTAMFTRKQFQELVLGLEISGRPFLLVVRPDCVEGTAQGGDRSGAFPDGFKDRVAERGRVAEWVPQQQVLAHPAIACFLCHCGWNSTMEGVANGTTLLSWPYSTDNFVSECYVCDVWRTGLRLVPDADGVVSKEQIKCKIEELLGDEKVKERAQELKRMAMASVAKGGSSFETLEIIADAMKQ